MNNKIVSVLIIDDSAYNRRAISEFLAEIPQIKIVGKAYDGQEGLQMAMTEKPDVITLDLEMPRLDGFSFLRLLMSSQPTPVIVISSHSEKENVFRALELGALDFVAKPTHRVSPEIVDIKDEVIRKVMLAGKLKPDSLHRLQSYAPADLSASGGFPVVTPDAEGTYTPGKEPPAERVVVIGSSTGGPATLTRILSRLPADLPASVLVAQHMPPRFTTTFSERLDRQCPMRVTELSVIDLARKGTIYICPGDRNLELTPGLSGTMITAVKPKSTDKYIPSADHLFRSAAATLKYNVMGIVLTGMGDDGCEGAMSIATGGGVVLVESLETAVVDGMPKAVINAGVPAHEEHVDDIAPRIIRFAEGSE